MNPRSRSALVILLMAASLGTACRVRLERPELEPARMIEPRLVEPAGAVADAPNATSVRLLETQGRGHIGRRLLHQMPSGEVTEDPVWLLDVHACSLPRFSAADRDRVESRHPPR